MPQHKVVAGSHSWDLPITIMHDGVSLQAHRPSCLQSKFEQHICCANCRSSYLLVLARTLCPKGAKVSQARVL